MRAAVENWLVRTWYSRQRPPWFLRSLEPVYRTLFRRVQKKGASASHRYISRLPLIVVGNLTAGGSGKTPLVMHLCRLAADLKLRPGIASTGYGRLGSDTIQVNHSSDVQACGDEPVMLAIRTGAPVVVAKHRVDAIDRLNEMNIDLIFSDDGLQQADLETDVEVCVVDGDRGFGNGHLLPAGPLREPVSRLKNVDYVITNGVWASKPGDLDVTVMQLHASRLCSLETGETLPVKEFLEIHKEKELHAIAGIGNPQRFFDTLEKLGIEAIPHNFPDHYSFTPKDFNFTRKDSVIIMTEKDAVKCRSFKPGNSWYLPVETRLPAEFESVFMSHLAKLIEERK